MRRAIMLLEYGILYIIIYNIVANIISSLLGRELSLAFHFMLGLDIAFFIVACCVIKEANKKRRIIRECMHKHKESKEFADIDCLKSLYEDFSALQQSLEKEVDKNVLLFEYRRTQEMFMHYDRLNWSIGSILIGSNIAALGFVSSASNPNPNILFAAALGGSISLFAWILWFYRHASIYDVKQDRLYMIENQLGMFQHRMVGYGAKQGLLARVSGRTVAFLLFAGLLFAWLLIVWFIA